MAEALKTLFDTFKEFIQRSILPSSTLWAGVFLVDVFFKQGLLHNKMLNYYNQNSTFFIVELIIVFLSLSYVLKIFHQSIFDNWIKRDYDSLFFRYETRVLKKLRTLVLEKAHKEYSYLNHLEANDFMLYQLLGKSQKSMKRYATDAKEIGITFILFFIIALTYFYSEISNVFIYIGASLIWYGIGFELIKSKYRSRAFRLYINYLSEKKREPFLYINYNYVA